MEHDVEFLLHKKYVECFVHHGDDVEYKKWSTLNDYAAKKKL